MRKPRGRKNPKGKKPREKRGSSQEPRKPKEKFVLENTSLERMRDAKRLTEQRLEFEWLYYNDLARQRELVAEEISESLVFGAVDGFKGTRWQRALMYKFSLTPLSVVGSLISPVGGRFNIGDLNPNFFPPFPALYMAQDKDTAMQELLCQENPGPLSNYDFALARPDSISVVSVSFELERCFDLHKENSLRKLTEILKKFRVSDHVRRAAKELPDVPRITLVREPAELQESFLDPEWRVNPMRYDIPANSQIFGQLLHRAGFNGVLYPSKMTGRTNVAVFTRTFPGTNSWVRLDDEPPAKVVRQLGAGNYQIAERTAQELGLGTSPSTDSIH